MDERVSRVWAQVAARALKAAVGMNVRVTAIVSAPVPADDLADVVQPGEMSALMENDNGDIGMVLVNPDLLTALIEIQTIGRVTERPVIPRAATPVDAALVAPSVDRILSSAGRALAESGLHDSLTDYRFAMLTEAGAQPTLNMADLLHRSVTMQLEVEGGRRQGTLRFVTPDTGASEEHRAAGRADWRQKMGEAVLSSDVCIDARIGRVRLPIEEILQLGPGDTLPLTREDLHRVRLVVGRSDLAARARLGQSNGFRAVKIVNDDAGEGDPVWSQADLNGAMQA